MLLRQTKYMFAIKLIVLSSTSFIKYNRLYLTQNILQLFLNLIEFAHTFHLNRNTAYHKLRER